MVSDEGRYPDGMVANRTMLTYESSAEVCAVIRSALAAKVLTSEISRTGYEAVRAQYSKVAQWQAFQLLAS